MLNKWWVWMLFFLIYFTIEFIVSLFFNYKISMITEKKYGWAALNGGTATFLFMFSTLIAAFVAVASNDVSTWIRVLFLFWTTTGTTLGNVISTILMPKINKHLENKKGKKENN